MVRRGSRRARPATGLLPPVEASHHIHRQSGRRTPLPDQRAHELIADQARLRPDAPAVSFGGETWTYAQLDGYANQVAHALLEQGLAREEVVAVATDRDLRWAAAMLGIFKAGGAYLPVDRTHPAARVRTMLAQARCRLMLTGADQASDVHASGPARTMTVDSIIAGTCPGTDPGVAVRAEHLAYVLFTSGSTGAPKGAMCEHLGMLNHLLAKIRDVDLTAGDVVLQSAAPSFDISLWQLLAPLLVGARAVILPEADLSDVSRLVATMPRAGVTIAQLVPSHLELLIRLLEQQPRELNPLRWMLVTGEALPAALVDRWFALRPATPLLNCYGATELSDDVLHAVMTAPVHGGTVPLGTPVANVDAYVLGPDGSPLPAGAVGELAFGGICVARGYINDPARTADVFTDDPFRPGQRLYRTGDFGRCAPTGALEFHGRRDEQAQLNGVRVELGEVEHHLLTHPRVRTAAVVVVGDHDSGRRLVAYYTAAGALAPRTLRDFLADLLPPAVVPSDVRRLDALPLTENGKTDKKALRRWAITDAPEPPAAVGGALATDAQHRLAEAWAEALGRPVAGIGPLDNFFDLGGTSLAAFRMVVALRGAVSLEQVLRFPVLRDLAEVSSGAILAPAGVLRRLTPTTTRPRRALVCLPYAAGMAHGFQPLADVVAARDGHTAVYALQAPGHDPGRPDEPLLDLPVLADRLLAELESLRGLPLALWGHCSGAALALELARRGEEAGLDLRHVFLAALLLRPPHRLDEERAEVERLSGRELAERFRVETRNDLLTAGDIDLVGRVYRHDSRQALSYLAAASRSWGAHRLSCAATVVVADDDRSTAGYQDLWRGWERFTSRLDLHEVSGGGHDFHQGRASTVADLALRSLETGPHPRRT